MVVLGLAFVVTLGGCPGGADLEHPELYGAPVTGTGGTGMAGMPAVARPLPVLADCPDVATQMTKDCASLGCHRNVAKPPAALNLTPDDYLISRLKDVAATHADIYCPDQVPPDTCSTIPAECPAPGAALLINTTSPPDSWMLAKLDGTMLGCGAQMPPAVYDPTHLACLKELIAAIAALPK